MSLLTNYQTIHNGDTVVSYVISAADFEKLQQQSRIIESAPPSVRYHNGVPHEVMGQLLKKVPLHRAWREFLGLTQKDVAKKAGITQAALSQLEKAKKIRKSTAQKLADAMGLTVDQIR